MFVGLVGCWLGGNICLCEGEHLTKIFVHHQSNLWGSQDSGAYGFREICRCSHQYHSCRPYFLPAWRLHAAPLHSSGAITPVAWSLMMVWSQKRLQTSSSNVNVKFKNLQSLRFIICFDHYRVLRCVPSFCFCRISAAKSSFKRMPLKGLRSFWTKVQWWTITDRCSWSCPVLWHLPFLGPI